MMTRRTVCALSPALTPLVKVGLANGCFDCFHAGHARFLWEAKQRCQYLIVGVNDDEWVHRVKGPTRPFEPLKVRMDRVAQYANLTVPFNGDAFQLLIEFKPDIVIRGWDQTIEPLPFFYVVLPRFGDTSTTGIANG